MICFPDVNVWIALAVAEHAHHAAARKWFDGHEGSMIAFCRVTGMGLLRLLTNPHVMGGDVLTSAQAWKVLDSFRQDSRIVFSSEPPELESHWRHLSGKGVSGPNHWTDAYLAAFAIASNYTLVTLDRALSRRKEAARHVLLLLPDA